MQQDIVFEAINCAPQRFARLLRELRTMILFLILIVMKFLSKLPALTVRLELFLRQSLNGQL